MDDNIRFIPLDATHVWTPGYQLPFVHYGVFRRSFYRKDNDVWYSFTFNKEWKETGNDQSWFEEQIKNGHFVTVEEFIKPEFECIPE